MIIISIYSLHFLPGQVYLAFFLNIIIREMQLRNQNFNTDFFFFKYNLSCQLCLSSERDDRADLPLNAILGTE